MYEQPSRDFQNAKCISFLLRNNCFYADYLLQEADGARTAMHWAVCFLHCFFEHRKK